MYHSLLLSAYSSSISKLITVFRPPQTFQKFLVTNFWITYYTLSTDWLNVDKWISKWLTYWLQLYLVKTVDNNMSLIFQLFISTSSLVWRSRPTPPRVGRLCQTTSSQDYLYRVKKKINVRNRDRKEVKRNKNLM